MIEKMRQRFTIQYGEVPKRLKGLASNTSRRVTPVRGFKSPSLRHKKSLTGFSPVSFFILFFISDQCLGTYVSFGRLLRLFFFLMLFFIEDLTAIRITSTHAMTIVALLEM